MTTNNPAPLRRERSLLGKLFNYGCLAVLAAIAVPFLILGMGLGSSAIVTIDKAPTNANECAHEGLLVRDELGWRCEQCGFIYAELPKPEVR